MFSYLLHDRVENRVLELIEILTLCCTYQDSILKEGVTKNFLFLFTAEEVTFIEYKYSVILCSDLLKSCIHHFDLIFSIWIIRIDNMQKEV